MRPEAAAPTVPETDPVSGPPELGSPAVVDRPRRLVKSGPGAAAASGAQDTLFRLAFQQASAGMAITGPDLHILQVNGALCRLLGLPERTIVGKALFSLLPPTAGATSLGRRVLRSRADAFHLERQVDLGGRAGWLELSLSVVRDPGGKPIHYIVMADDITRRKESDAERDRVTRELQAQAITDPLTGVFNHRYMQEHLAQRLSEGRRNGQAVSVLMLDLDHFRALNETYGHDAGDRALRAVARSMRAVLRDYDVACRYGGEEFVMILAGAPHDAGLAAAERVRQRVEGCRPLGATSGPITCSLGVATFPTHASTPASLLKAADMALYEAKRAGRNCVRGYVAAPFSGSPEEIEKLKEGLRGATHEAVNAVVTAVDLRDRFTGAHCQRVTRTALDLAARLGCSDREMEILRAGAPLLDIGKVGVNDHILTKPAALTGEEWMLMRQHPIWGEQLLRQAGMAEEVLELVRWHHERLDGSGYPDGLVGDDIPWLVRIVAVADITAALRDDRPHRRAWSRARITEYLRKQAGKKLDAEVVAALCAPS